MVPTPRKPIFHPWRPLMQHLIDAGQRSHLSGFRNNKTAKTTHGLVAGEEEDIAASLKQLTEELKSAICLRSHLLKTDIWVIKIVNIRIMVN